MHSLNQVNKLVSCGRDPARSLPFWRGFLLIPLILVCFAFAPQRANAAPQTPDPAATRPFNTADGDSALVDLNITGAANTAFGWFSLVSTPPAQLQYWRWCWNAGFQPRRYVTRPLALLPCCSMSTGARNTAVGGAALVYNVGDAERQRIISMALSAPLRSTITKTGFSNNAVGDSALFGNIVWRCRIPLLVILRSE